MKNRQSTFKGFRRKAWFVGNPDVIEDHRKHGDGSGLVRGWRDGEPLIGCKDLQIGASKAVPRGKGPEPLRRPYGGRVPDTMPEPQASTLRAAFAYLGKRDPTLGGGLLDRIDRARRRRPT